MAESETRNGPEVWSLLSASLDTYQDEHEEQFERPPADQALFDAFDQVEDFGLKVLTTGEIPKELDDKLSAFDPGSSIQEKVARLLSYNVVQHRIEFDVARDVVWRLKGLGKRIGATVIAFHFLQRSRPSPTAVKYLQRAAGSYLAGFSSEVSIMCGAVLEAALATRFPDSVLAAGGWTPAYRKMGVFSFGQRIQYEERHPILSNDLRKQLRNVANWRNDAVHVQPDIGPDPALVLLMTGQLLGAILPGTD